MLTKFKHKRSMLASLAVTLAVTIIVALFLSRQKSGLNNLPPVVSNNANVPPVVIEQQELKLVKIHPEPGPREDLDAFTPTVFEFDAEVDPTSFVINANPYIQLRSRVFNDDKKLLWVVPASVPWKDGLEYTLTISPGGMSVTGAILKGKIEYKFSNKSPTVIEGGDPLPVQ